MSDPITNLLTRLLKHYEDSRHDFDVVERAQLIKESRRVLAAMNQVGLVDRLFQVRNALEQYVESFSVATISKQDVAIIPRNTHDRLLAALEILTEDSQGDE
jgi:hypothetical protein